MTESTPQTTRLDRQDRDPVVRRMALACLFGFGGFIAWSAVAPLEEGVAASGQIVVEDNRQKVQHLEGGIVSELRVREGEHVRAGDVLVVLQRTASLASRDQVVQEYGALAASVARLRALQDGASAPDFARLDTLDLGELERAEIVRRETSLFREQGSALAAEIAVLDARIRSAQQLRGARMGQIAISARALSAAEAELELTRGMVAQQLARREQLTGAERLVAQLQGDIAALRSEADDARTREADLRAQIGQVRASAARDIATDLLETSAELLAAEERLNAAQDVLDRAVITAPVSGEVLNMTASTIGGVIAPGEAMMEIVPPIAEVTASVKIAAPDRSAVFEGQRVRTQFTSYRGWQAPRLIGEVIDISADLKTDAATNVSYYEARIRVSQDELARTTGVDVRPGLPVDAFIFSGRARTLGDYLLEPLGESLFRGLRTS